MTNLDEGEAVEVGLSVWWAGTPTEFITDQNMKVRGEEIADLFHRNSENILTLLEYAVKYIEESENEDRDIHTGMDPISFVADFAMYWHHAMNQD